MPSSILPRTATRRPRCTRRSFENQVIWITGASSGIGEALALQLSREGARVILSARDPVRLKRVQAQCPGETAVVPLDLGHSGSLPERARVAIAATGR